MRMIESQESLEKLSVVRKYGLKCISLSGKRIEIDLNYITLKQIYNCCHQMTITPDCGEGAVTPVIIYPS